MNSPMPSSGAPGFPSPMHPGNFPELSEIRKWAHRLHITDPTWYIERLWDVDADALRNVAQTVWGTDGFESPAQLSLKQLPHDLNTALLETVENRWEGQAYEAFSSYMDKVKSGIKGEANSLPVVGQALLEFSEFYEVKRGGLLSHAVTVAGLIVAVVGAAVALTTSWSGVGAIIGLIAALLGLALAFISEMLIMITKINSAMRTYENLDNVLELHSSTGSPLAGNSPNSGVPRGGWNPKTSHPET